MVGTWSPLWKAFKKSDITEIFFQNLCFFLEVVHIKELALYNINIRRYFESTGVFFEKFTYISELILSEILNRHRNWI